MNTAETPNETRDRMVSLLVRANQILQAPDRVHADPEEKARWFALAREWAADAQADLPHLFYNPILEPKGNHE